MTETIKAKRKLSNFNFDVEGAHVALVGPSVGGAANGHTTLLTKSVEATDVEVDKASMVTVTLSITEYLRKFFDLWYEDAEILARIMGMDTKEESTEYNDDWYEDYLNSKVAAVSIMKSLVLDKDELEIAKSVSELIPKDYLVILKSQEQFEKNFEVVSSEASLKKSSGIPAKGVTVSKETTSPSVEIDKHKEDSMSEFLTKAAHEEAVTKAVEEAIAKAVAPIQEELQKAKEQLEEVEKAKLEAVTKERKEKLAKAVPAEEVEELYKSTESLTQEAFEVILKSLKVKGTKEEESDLFKEKGVSGEGEPTKQEEAGLKLVGDLINKSKTK